MYRASSRCWARSGRRVAQRATVGALQAAGDRAKEPLREFLLKHSAGRDRATFHSLALRMRAPAERAASPIATC
jgi:type III secretion protein R